MSAIAWVIFGLFAVGSVALALRDRTQSKERRASWHLVWLFAMLLEVEAMKARDRGKGRKVTPMQFVMVNGQMIVTRPARYDSEPE